MHAHTPQQKQTNTKKKKKKKKKKKARIVRACSFTILIETVLVAWGQYRNYFLTPTVYS